MMHLQSPLQNQNVSLSLSSSPCYSSSLPFKLSTHTLGQTQRVCYQRLSVTCSISKIHSYGTVDYERRPIVRWNDIYKRISLMQNPELGSSSVLNQWENEGKNLTKWELCRVVKELRKYRRHARALEVYEWMNNRPERFRVSASDTAIQLDLIAKVRGVSSAERFFLNLTEMKEKNVQLDIYSYNIWLSSSGSQGSVEKMEQVFEEMAKDPTIVPNWTTFSTMATMYIKMDQFEKAEECLRKVESRIKGRDRIPFHYLLSLYGSVGNKDEVYRVWNTYKSIFPSIPNLGYHAIISSLVRMDDIEGAEQLYEEWVSVRSSNDARIGNLLIGWYVKNGNTDKALSFFQHMTEEGGYANSNTWELLSEGHIADKRISEALSCLEKAFTTDGSKSWRPRPLNLSAFFKLCEDQDDMASAEVLIGLLRQSGFLKDEAYASLIGLPDVTIGKGELSSTIDTEDRTDNIVDSENADDDSQMLFNQLESSI
ncbi:Tetratricopeptide-like helical domain superfamily [Sesbania bispinosa]|nr:Tetratricopeptide-like helical domain superfamily [Sesbania bispinosa]